MKLTKKEEIKLIGIRLKRMEDSLNQLLGLFKSHLLPLNNNSYLPVIETKSGFKFYTFEGKGDLSSPLNRERRKNLGLRA